MDLLKEFTEKHEHLNIHDFFRREYEAIQLHNTQIKLEDECWEGLRAHWKKIVDEFAINHPEKKITRNLFRVDWEELYNISIIHKNKKRLRSSVVQEHTSIVDNIVNENPFSIDPEPSLCNIIYTSKIESVKKDIKYEPVVAKQDLLYYNILDFVSKNKENGTRRALGDKYNFFVEKYHRRDFQKNKKIGDIVQQLFKETHHDNFDLKKLLKAKKNENDNNDDETKKLLTKRIIQALKVYKHFFKEDNYQKMNESEYTYLLVRPLIKIVLKDMQLISIKCGEPNLRCASKRQNEKLFDEERRNPGPKIDMIFTNKVFEQEVSTLEVSGPYSQTNYSHFLEDRNKTAKNLKHILKTIIGSIPPSSASAVKKLKVYGFQLYDNCFYVYSLYTPNTKNFIFSLEAKFQIPMSLSTLRQNSPKFFSKLWIIKELFLEMNNNLKEMYETSLENCVVSSSDSDSVSSPTSSPKKKQKTKKSD